ncbi:hypothetical protein J4434_06835 [Candidatus Woesearchaeota archaeon]|nr:hypothetical protein [Candidatus Woesearchaeota archaeon]
MLQFWWKLKRHLTWKTSEIRDILITILAVAFIFAYDDKQPVFHFNFWLFNFFKHILIVGLCVMIYDLGHKVSSIFMNLTSEYKMWSVGLLIGVIIAVLSKGKIYLILPGGILFHHWTVMRLGHFRYGLNYFTTGLLAAMGPVFLLLFATFFKTIALFGLSSDLFNRITFIFLYFAIFAMLPFPRHDGAHLYFANRNWYVIFLFFLIGYIFLYKLHFYSLIFAALIGLVVWLIYYITFEESAWAFG